MPQLASEQWVYILLRSTIFGGWAPTEETMLSDLDIAVVAKLFKPSNLFWHLIEGFSPISHRGYPRVPFYLKEHIFPIVETVLCGE